MGNQIMLLGMNEVTPTSHFAMLIRRTTTARTPPKPTGITIASSLNLEAAAVAHRAINVAPTITAIGMMERRRSALTTMALRIHIAAVASVVSVCHGTGVATRRDLTIAMPITITTATASHRVLDPAG